MTLQRIGAGIDYVQDGQPSGANDAEVWLDTSTNPSTIKIYDEDEDSWDEAKGEHIDADISSRSSHEWDPDDRIDQKISEAGGASKEEVEEAVNDAEITNDIYRAIERRVSEIWSEDSEFDDWNLGDMITVDEGLILGTKLAQDVYDPDDDITESSGGDTITEDSIYDQNTDFEGIIGETDAWISLDFPENVYIEEFRHYGHKDMDGDGEISVETYDGSDWNEQTSVSTRDDSWSDWISVGVETDRIRWRATTMDSGSGELRIGEVEMRLRISDGEAISPAQSPSAISTWDLANYDADEDGETVTFDLVDSDGNSLQDDISDGEDISDISTDESVSIRATLSRDDTSNDPTVNNAALRWIE